MSNAIAAAGARLAIRRSSMHTQKCGADLYVRAKCSADLYAYVKTWHRTVCTRKNAAQPRMAGFAASVKRLNLDMSQLAYPMLPYQQKHKQHGHCQPVDKPEYPFHQPILTWCFSWKFSSLEQRYIIPSIKPTIAGIPVQQNRRYRMPEPILPR